jgi:hypothetical protein
MDKLHITQDDYGYWMLSLEDQDGTLSLLAHHFATPEHLIENANELISEGRVNAVVVIDPPRAQTGGSQAAALAVGAPEDYKKPAPRKAGV